MMLFCLNSATKKILQEMGTSSCQLWAQVLCLRIELRYSARFGRGRKIKLASTYVRA